jgi:hypothetical protein
VSCAKAIAVSTLSDLVTLIVCTLVAFATAITLGMSEERGTMTWFARPYFLLPLYVFPTLAANLITLNLFRDKISVNIIGTQGKV